MNMPALTAEASLYPRRARYQIRAMLAGFRQPGEIVPSLKVMRDCEYALDGESLCCNSGAYDETGKNVFQQQCCSTPSDPSRGVTCIVFWPRMLPSDLANVHAVSGDHTLIT